jgi:hypothetical protein
VCVVLLLFSCWCPHLCAAITNLRSNKVVKSKNKIVLVIISAGTTRTELEKMCNQVRNRTAAYLRSIKSTGTTRSITRNDVFWVDGVKVNPCQKIQKYEDDISCRRAEVVPQALLCCLLVTLYECC